MEAKIIERYNGHVGVSGAYMMEMLGSNMYCQALHRGHIRSLRRGGNGRTALIDWQSMGTKMKARVIEELGCDPAQMSRESLLRSILQKEISIPVSGPIDTKEYTVPGEITIMDAFRLDSARAELMPGGVYLTCACTALDASAEDTDDREETASMLYELQFRQEDGNEFPAGMDLSTRIKGIDKWPVVEREELLSVNDFPEKIVMILPDEAETKITRELKK